MTKPTDNQNNSRLLKGGVWAVSARWSVKFLGLISTLFIVRLLAPQDFGIVMKAMVIVGPIKTFVNTGFSETLIRIRQPNKAHYDTAFTANIILSFIVALFLVLIAPICAMVFNEEALKFLIPVMGIKVLLSGLINPRIKDFLRDFEYVKDFKYLIMCKIISIICVVSACFYYKDYNGLIVGQIGGILGAVCISYYIVSYKPNFSFEYIKEFVDFSVPNMRASFGDNILMNLDRILLARYLGNVPLGFYNLAYELAEQFTTEVIYPLARGFFPVFAEIEHNKEKLRQTYLSGLSFLIPFCLAIGTGLSLITEPLIMVYAGEKWLPTIPILSMLALSSAAQSFCLVNTAILAAIGHVRMRATLTNSNAVLSAIIMFPFAIKGDIDTVLIIKLCVALCFVVVNLYFLSNILKIQYLEIIKASVRPVLSTIIMYFVISNITINNYYLELIMMFFMGLVSFMLTHFTLWILMGKPQTIERTIIQRIRKHLIIQ